MLRITRATDPIAVERLVLCIYSPPGVGKTTLAFTADKPLLLDFDSGVYRAATRHDSVAVNSWADVESISGDDLKQYKTVVLDTAGRALDVLTADIIRSNPKLGRSGGALTLQGYGELKSRFIAFTKLIRSFGLDIILLAHCDEQKNGDDLIERIDVQGGSKNEIYKVADVMGRLYIRNNQRFLNFNPSDTAYGKNPGQLAELPVPNVADSPAFLAGVITKVKNTLNKLTAEQQDAATALTDWQTKLDAIQSPIEFNHMITKIAELPEAVKANVGRLWVKVGRAKGWEQDKETKQFIVEPNGDGFNPLSQNGKDGATKTQMKSILQLAGELDVADVDDDASKVFGVPVKIDDLSKEGASRYVADLTARADSAGGAF